MDAEYENVQYIRFRKQLSVFSKPVGGAEWHDYLNLVARARENTVLVVQATKATKVIELLKKLEISSDIGFYLQAVNK